MDDFEVGDVQNKENNLKLYNEDKTMVWTTCCIRKIDQTGPQLLLATKEEPKTS